MDVLIIDDDAVDRIAAKKTLRSAGLQVRHIVETSSAEAGIEHAHAHRFDLVLLDYRLPPTNGIEVTRRLREQGMTSMAIIMLSHSQDESIAIESVEAGAQDFLMKSELSGMRLKRAILMARERYQMEQQIRSSHDQLKQLAECDTLTGLANRYYFEQSLKVALDTAGASEGNEVALLLLDLDKFKDINDTLGHAIGDRFLREVAKRLSLCMREGDLLSRLGGDEFCILIRRDANIGRIRMILHRIFDSFREPVRLLGHEQRISSSIGVATFPESATTPEELMKCADVAMYRAKESGKNQAHHYSRHIHNELQKRIRLEGEIQAALAQKQFELYYQPQVSGETLQLVGVEALIRWNHPRYGLLAPDQFISIAEESDLINQLGRWVLQEACRQFNDWADVLEPRGLQFTIAVNLSARQLRNSGLLDDLRKLIAHYDIPPELLELELTESSLETSLSAMETLNEITAMGIQLALDDFGTGYSSLSHLHEYPFHVLKIDKSFVQSAETPARANFLRAVSAFAHSLEFATVAEGVETEAQSELCQSLGIHRLQGYYFAKPMPASELKAQWLMESGEFSGAPAKAGQVH
ncbi:putative bifunctional diguanylate cyclase/phosphodiesterase [Pokkaliibacter sp. CJK22405]|uniref:putative bifunctional diguanylate cyclase/phosphodiesterase n=1 Tax=Pokkaliibacter sp. CJK22405 TaxID=3384615 RepID=UPI003984AD44